MCDEVVLDVRGLVRSFGWRRRIDAVRGVDLTVVKGEIFGLIGPDGAGKTSILQTLAGVLRVQQGEVHVAGIDVAADPDAVKACIGYMPQGLGSNLYDSLTVGENIEFFRDLRQLPDALYAANRRDLLRVTRLEAFLERRVSTLSGGMRQKLALICALIHLPSVLLLDEPTTGVDPISRQEFWQVIGRVVDERQTTVLISTSYMDEAERCHRIALMHAGRIVASGTPAAVRGTARGRFACLRAHPQARALDVLRATSCVSDAQAFGDEIRVAFDGELDTVTNALQTASLSVDAAGLRAPTLEDVFLQLLGRTADRVAPRFASRVGTGTGDSIECRQVTRRFGSFAAVNALDLTVRRGEVFGLLGPNGAGKTTLIKMMCGLLLPTAGSIAIGGLDAMRDRAQIWTAIGYMSQRFSLYQDLTVRQNLQLYGDLFGLRAASYADLLSWLGLADMAGRLTRDLPSGVKQRLSLLCAVLHRPSILFLDEPTSGVDPAARRAFWDLIFALSRDARITVLISTHYMDEAGHCDRLGLMNAGRLIAEGSPEELKARSLGQSGELLAVYSSDNHAAHRILLDAGRHDALLFGDHVRLRSPDPDSDIRDLSVRLSAAHVAGVRIDRAELSIDDAFIDCVRHAEAAHA